MTRRIVASLVVTLALVCSFVLSNAAAQGIPTVGGITFLSIRGVDTNGNGLFDELRVTFVMNVTEGGNFEIRTQLMTSGYYYNYTFYENDTAMNLSAGNHTLTTSLPGPAIYHSGIDGPYSVQISPVAVLDSGAFLSPPFPPYGGVAAVTPAMLHTDFDASWVLVNGPLSDEGQDTNGNGLFDYLAVHVPLSVTDRRPFSISGRLHLPSSYITIPSVDDEPHLLPPGDTVWTLRFDGRYIAYGLKIYPAAGPFTVDVTIYVDGSGVWNMTRYTAGTYFRNQFELPPASPVGQSFNGTPEDTNGDGLAEFFDFHIPVAVTTEGDYIAFLILGSYGPGTTNMQPATQRLLHLKTGTQTVDFRISGIAMSRLQPTASLSATLYFIQMLDMYPSSLLYGVFPADAIQWSMPFPSAAFNAPPVQPLTVAVSGFPTSCVQVEAVDPTTRAVATSYAYSGFGNVSSVTLSLYDGSFSLLVSSCMSPEVATAMTVAVSGPTTAAAVLPEPRPVDVQATVVPTNWNRTKVAVSANLGDQSLNLRFIADIAGNFDGTADASELRLAAKLYLSDLFGYPPGPYGFSIPDLRMGNTPLQARSATVLGARGTGSIVSMSSVDLQASFLYSSPDDLGPAPRTLSVRAPYADGNATYHLRVDASVFDAGAASGRSIMPWGDGGFTWDTNAAIQSVGVNVWDVSVGPKPAYLGADVLFEFQVDLTGGPHIASLDLVLMLALIVAPAVIALVAFLLARRRPRSGGPRGAT